ncbi:MAG TPA: hypothetical protein VK783_10300 [Bacteroidia bacterium]|jgi:hypothetical protein|nr:hypothetical protein [Bacteroidia bacterium]
MKITIHDKRKIKEIQEEFADVFPNLQLHFFATPLEAKKASHERILIHPSKAIGECRVKHVKGELDIMPHMTIGELKHGLNDVFGLTAQVYRKVGNDWLETVTDTWTLDKHNGSCTELNAENTLEII